MSWYVMGDVMNVTLDPESCGMILALCVDVVFPFTKNSYSKTPQEENHIYYKHLCQEHPSENRIFQCLAGSTYELSWSVWNDPRVPV